MKQDGFSSSSAKSGSHNRKRKATEGSLNDNGQIREITMNKAKEIERNLNRTHQYPTFIRPMIPSTLANSFQLTLLSKFCDRHMPVVNKQFTLKVEDGREFPVNFYRREHKIRGGWRAFAVEHGLQVGDVLVFQLVQPLKFMVYIVRANASKEVVAQSLLKSDCAVKREPGPLVGEVEENNGTTNSFMDHEKDHSHITDGGMEPDKGFENGSDSETKVTESVANDFGQVKCFDEFKIVANGSVINDKLSELHLSKYYQLCLSQSSFLHQHLLEGLDASFIASMIASTVDVADSIIAASSKVGSAGRAKDFVTWESKLKAFEQLGMKVGSLLIRLKKVVQYAEKVSRYEKLMAERAAAKEELQNLAMQVDKVGERVKVLDAEIENLGLGGSGGGGINRGFEELANAPW